MVFEPAPASVNAAWLNPALVIAFGIILLAALAWPVRALVRRRFKADFALQGKSLRPYPLSRVFACLAPGSLRGWIGLLAARSHQPREGQKFFIALTTPFSPLL